MAIKKSAKKPAKKPAAKAKAKAVKNKRAKAMPATGVQEAAGLTHGTLPGTGLALPMGAPAGVFPQP